MLSVDSWCVTDAPYFFEVPLFSILFRRHFVFHFEFKTMTEKKNLYFS